MRFTAGQRVGIELAGGIPRQRLPELVPGVGGNPRSEFDVAG